MGSVWVSENVTPDAATGSIGLRWRLCPFVLHFLDRDLRLLPGRRSPPLKGPSWVFVLVPRFQHNGDPSDVPPPD